MPIVYSIWKEYRDFFNVKTNRTAEKRLKKLGFKIPKYGPPMIRRSVLEQRVDNASA